MKKLLLFLSAFCILGFAQAQSLSKGPKAKNAKVWKTQDKSLKVVFHSSPQTLTGAEAKNFKQWNSESAKLQIRTRSEINNPKGLEAKNRKVWEESQKVQVNSKASYIEPKSMRKKKLWWH